MKKLIIFMFSIVLLGSCISNNNYEDRTPIAREHLLRKLVSQYTSGKDVKIVSFKKVDDLTFKSTHTFIALPINYSDTTANRDNPDTLRLSDLFSELRVTKKYFFNSTLDSILNDTLLKSEVRRVSDWQSFN